MIRVNNKNYSIAFEENLKRLAFFGKEDNILSEKQPAIFKMRFIRNGDTYVISSNDACKVVVKSYDSNGAVLEYSDFSNDDLTVNLCVKASETDNSFAWSIDIQKNSNQLDWVEMPCFAIKDTFKRNGGNSTPSR